jgi:hypothetical protein
VSFGSSNAQGGIVLEPQTRRSCIYGAYDHNRDAAISGQLRCIFTQ